MAGRTMDLSILVRLVDRITGPLGALQRRFAQFAALGQRIGILGAAAAAISFMAPIQSAAAFDQSLRDIVVTANYVGDAAERRITALSNTVSQLALQVGIASSSLVEAGGLLIAAGMDEALAERMLTPIARVSKAASALPNDVAKVAFALNNTLRIPVEQSELALAKLVTAGKLGRFEFRDMAREIPELAAQFQKFGITGMEAVETIGASLQVAMFGTDNTQAAANNFKNFLSKLLSPEAIKKFSDMGVNITGVMQNAAARGINPIEAAIQKIVSLTGLSAAKLNGIFTANKAKGMTDAEATAAALEQIKNIAGAEKLGALFGDMQVLDFLLPMLANINAYKEFKAEIANAGLDVIAKDYATQWAGLSTQLSITGEIGTQAVNRIGLAFGANLPWINELGIAALGWVRDVDAKYPGVIDQVLALGGAFLAAVAGLAIMVPVLSVLSAAFGVLAGVIGFILSPIGLVVAALAGLAYLIYSQWDELAPFFQDMWAAVTQAFDAGVAMIKALFSGDWAGAEAAGAQVMAALGDLGGKALDVLTRALGPVLAAVDEQLGGVPSKLLAIGAGIGTALGSAWSVLATRWGPGMEELAQGAIDWAAALPGRIFEAFGGESGPLGERFRAAFSGVIDRLAGASDEEWAELGTRVGTVLAENLEAAVSRLSEFFSGLPGRIMSWIGSIDIGGLIKWPSLPSWLGGGEATPPPHAGNDNAPAAPAERLGRLAPASSVAGNAKVGGQIVVSAAPGSQVESVKSSNPAVPLKRADNGRVVGRV